MLNPEEIVLARPTINVTRDVRVIRALYPHECLGQISSPLSPHSIAKQQRSPRIYHNTSVQTLPPPNGEVYKLVYGQKPSQAECIHNMSSAAIGRYAKDPRCNTYEYMYGMAYLAPPTEEQTAHVDSGFQTITFDARKEALVRAKVKASVTVLRYFEAAARAGYSVFAESKDDLIVHSEQYFTTVRLDPEGNLLQGTISSCYLPNICGIPLHAMIKESTQSKVAAVPLIEQSSHLETYEHPGTLGMPSLPAMTALTAGKASPSSCIVMGRSLIRQTFDQDPFTHMEPSNAGSEVSRCTAYDTRASFTLSAPLTKAKPAHNLGKQQRSIQNHPELPSTTARIRAAKPRRHRLLAAATQPGTHRSSQDGEAILTPSSSDHAVASQLLHGAKPPLHVAHEGRNLTCPESFFTKSSFSNLPDTRTIEQEDLAALQQPSTSSPKSSARGETSSNTQPTDRFEALATPASISPFPAPKQPLSSMQSQPGNHTPHPAKPEPDPNVPAQKRTHSTRGSHSSKRHKTSPTATDMCRAASWQLHARDEAVSKQTAPSRAQKKSMSRAQRGTRRPCALYVPPAKRVKAQQAGKDNRTPEGDDRT